MRPLAAMDTIQIELTNACTRRCSNCTRFCGHRKPFYLKSHEFRTALESLLDFPHMIGFMGGEPLLHPKFAEFCEYARQRVPKERLGLWTSLPPGMEYYREIICETFGHIFINDHTRDDVLHAPILVASEEVFQDRRDLFLAVDNCWVQMCWSAAINPKGAFFCEIAAAMAVLFDGPRGWPVEPGWWKRVPKDFAEQQEWYCPKCGAALPFPRRRSNDIVDDVSPGNLERLKAVRSMKVQRGEFVVSDMKLVANPGEMAAYKDVRWRNQVARRYGLYLHLNEQGFLTPVLLRNWRPEDADHKTVG